MNKNLTKSVSRGMVCMPIFSLLPIAVNATDSSNSDIHYNGNYQRPNFIVILTDDMGYQDVGFNGCKDIRTPNIDRIALEGMKFTNAYVTYSVSSPSRAGIMTGRYGQRFGYERNAQYQPGDPNMGLPLDEMTIAQSLRTVGYTSCAVGKWHLGAHPTLHPLNRGFDEFFGFLGGGHRYFPEEYRYESYDVNTEENSYRTYLLKNHDHVKIKGYLTDELSNAAVDFVKTHKDGPFFLYLAYNAPHSPLQATDKYLSRYENIKDPKRKKYAAMLSAVDDGVGKLLDYLDEAGIADNTIIWFLSDNGGPEQTNGSDNGPLRGGKSSTYEGGYHVPYAMRWPGHIPAGKVFTKTVSSLDIFATASGLTGAKTNKEKPLDGVNLIPYITGEDTRNPHPVIYLRKFDNQSFSVRKDDWKLLLFQKNGDVRELYDLANDLGETKNLIKQHANIADEIEVLRKEWNNQLIDPVFEGILMRKKPEIKKLSKWK